MIELADRLDRSLEPPIVVQPAANLIRPLAPHTHLPLASSGIAHCQHRHRVAFAARATRASFLVANNALQQRAAQQFPRDRQIVDQPLARAKGAAAIHL